MLLHLGIGLVAAATIVYEVALTRIFSLAYGYHFAFLAMSLGLLGFGMSGTLISLRPGWCEQLRGVRLGWLALAGSVTFAGGYLLANHVPLDPYRVGWDPGQLPLLAAYLLAFALPFLLTGLVQGLPITAWPDLAGKIYASSLAGSGMGGLLALGALATLSAPSALTAAAGAAAAAALLLSRSAPGGPNSEATESPKRQLKAVALLSAAMVGALAVASLAPPKWLEVRMSEYKPLPQLLRYPDSRTVLTASNAQSRVDVVESSSVHSAPGMSLKYQGAMPRQSALVIDGERIVPLTPIDQLDPGFVGALPSSLAYQLRPQARTLVLEPGGGLEVSTALRGGADSVVALESNPLMTELLLKQLGSRTGRVYQDPRVRLLDANPRAYLAQEREPFDVISVALSENRRTVTAGAFSLSENFLMTAQAFESYLDRLRPGGILMVHRWLQLPPTEELRTAALMAQTLGQRRHQAARHLVAIRSFSTMLILAKNEPFTPGEISATRAFAAARQYDLVHHPGIRASESNRSNVLQNDRYYESFRALLAGSEAFHQSYEYDVGATSDDRPFFFHFFKWGQIPTVIGLMGKTWQPFGGGGYLLVLGLLGVTTLLAAVMILLPALRVRRDGTEPRRAGLGRAGLYFAMLGLGFLMVEVALVGRFLLVLNHSALAFTLVLFGLLVFSGLGSLLSSRIPWRVSLASVVLLSFLYAVGLSPILQAMLATGLPARIAGVVLLLAPLGFLMGVAFPAGLRRLAEEGPELLPLAWGVNGFTSVMGAVLAALVSLSWGYSVVLACGGLAYLIALAGLGRTGSFAPR